MGEDVEEPRHMRSYGPSRTILVVSQFQPQRHSLLYIWILMVRTRLIVRLCLLTHLQQLIANVDCLQADVSVEKKKGLAVSFPELF
jgi:hypothetical protein